MSEVVPRLGVKHVIVVLSTRMQLLPCGERVYTSNIIIVAGLLEEPPFAGRSPTQAVVQRPNKLQ